MKCLTNIVEVDPSILKRKDMKIGVSQKFLDQSISVREAAVDLIGKYVLTSPDLINQYYQMLSDRILVREKCLNLFKTYLNKFLFISRTLVFRCGSE